VLYQARIDPRRTRRTLTGDEIRRLRTALAARHRGVGARRDDQRSISTHLALSRSLGPEPRRRTRRAARSSPRHDRRPHDGVGAVGAALSEAAPRCACGSARSSPGHAAKCGPFIIRPEYFAALETPDQRHGGHGEFRWASVHDALQWKRQAAAVARRCDRNRRKAGCWSCSITHLIDPGIRPDMEIRERITLHEAAGITRVTKAVTIREPPAPRVLIVLICSSAISERAWGPDLLKQMCERDA